MNEAQTEFEYIDPALREAGWGVVEGKLDKKAIVSKYAAVENE